jgi:hypothetical protein
MNYTIQGNDSWIKNIHNLFGFAVILQVFAARLRSEKHVATYFQKLVKILQKPIKMLALPSQLLFAVAFDTYRLRIKRKVMQKSDKLMNKNQLKLMVQQRAHSTLRFLI